MRPATEDTRAETVQLAISKLRQGSYWRAHVTAPRRPRLNAARAERRHQRPWGPLAVAADEDLHRLAAEVRGALGGPVQASRCREMDTEIARRFGRSRFNRPSCSRSSVSQ